MIRVLVVSDVRIYREGLAGMLAARPNIEVVGQAAGAELAADRAWADAAPDVVLLDVRGVADTGPAVALLRDAFPDVQVVALSVPNSEPELIGHAEAGVAGFVTSDASFDGLVEAIESAARGEALCPPWLAGALLRRLAARARESRVTDPPPSLTVRELEVVELIDEGCSNKQIAQRLRIELPTVKNHVHSILGKLGVERRSEAAALVFGGTHSSRD